MKDAINVELIETNFLTRYPCHVCGGCTEKVEILAEVTEGEYEGFRVCERCIAQRDFDEQLLAQAEALEQRAGELRGLVGRLEVPSLAEWDRAIKAEREAQAGCGLAH